jgi:glycosyltransferase involved in cell wall biosynthesis
MPVYNGEPYLRGALEALVAQTFDDLELVISDNASTDATEAICRAFAARDPRIRYIRRAATTEASANFTSVLDEARAPYFMWAAHDDLWSANLVTALHGALERSPRAVSAQGECVLIDAAGQELQRGVPSPGMAAPSAARRVARVMRYGLADRYNNMFTYGLHRTPLVRRFGIRPVLFSRRGESRYNELPLVFALAAAGPMVAVPGAQFLSRVHAAQYGQRSERDVPMRDLLRLEAGLIASLPGAVWRGSRSVSACLTAVSVVGAVRAKYLVGLARTRLGGAAVMAK